MTAQPTAKSFIPVLQRSAAATFEPIQREFNRLFDDMSAALAFSDLPAIPRLDMHETADAVEVTAELPGIGLEDVKIDVQDETLTLSGEKKAERESLEGDVRISERSYGAFRRSVTLPRSVQVDKITATMADGVLKIVAPKDRSVAPKSIKIEAARPQS